TAPGILWLGTIRNGLIKFNLKPGTFNTYLEPVGDINRTGSNSISSIYQSTRTPGILWLGTANGLLQFDIGTGTATTPKIMKQLEHCLIKSILEDGYGDLWLGSEEGLFKFNPYTGDTKSQAKMPPAVRGAAPKRGGSFEKPPLDPAKLLFRGGPTLKRYDLRDGLQGNLFTTAAFKSVNGEMYFGGTNGFNVFHPGKLKDNTRVPPMVITDFKLFNKTVKIGDLGRDGNPILAKSISETSTITLSYKDKIFSFTFAALDFNIPEKNRYAYKMEGFDENWNDIGENRTAAFTGLPPGTYRFRVKGSHNVGAWNHVGVALGVIV
ncbi:MAG: hypothetical protein GY940_21490, partial [bacterium]|nr:hypothetical protein [bacterium]